MQSVNKGEEQGGGVEVGKERERKWRKAERGRQTKKVRKRSTAGQESVSV